MNLLYALSDSPYADINGTKLAPFRVRPKLLDNFFDWFFRNILIKKDAVLRLLVNLG